MIPIVGAISSAIMIFVMFRLSRRDLRISKSAWVPLIWLLIASSRPVSNWMTFSSPVDASTSYIDGSPIDRNVLTLILLLATPIIYQRRRQIVSIVRANPAIVAYFGFCLLSMLWAEYPFVLLKRWIRSVGDVAMMLILMTETPAIDTVKAVVLRIGYILLPLSILFIRFFPSLGRAYSNGGAPMWTGVATDKNALGALCMLTGVALLWSGLTEMRKPRRERNTRGLLTTAAFFTMALYLLLVANSQTALMCFALASVIIVLTVFRVFRTPVVLSTIVFTMIAVCVAVLFLGIGGSALSALGRNSTLTGRTEVWQTVLPFARNPLLGAGYENFWIGDRLWAIEKALGSGLNQAHNGYIEIYLNIGWIGLALLIGVIISGYRNIMRVMRVDPDAGRLQMAFFFICLVYSCTEAAFKMMSPVWMLFLWASIAGPEVQRKKVSSIKAAPPRRVWFQTESMATPGVRMSFDRSRAMSGGVAGQSCDCEPRVNFATFVQFSNLFESR